MDAPAYEQREELTTGQRLFLWANAIVAFGAIGVIGFAFDVGVCRYILDLGPFGLVLVGGGLAFLSWFLALVLFASHDRRLNTVRVPVTLFGRSFAAIWAGAIVVFLAAFLLTTMNDARAYNGHNCWGVQDSERDEVRVEILECAPGSEPTEGSSYDSRTESGGYRFCDQLSRTPSGITPRLRPTPGRVTVWRCESGEL